jgi:hypothetical protein
MLEKLGVSSLLTLVSMLLHWNSWVLIVKSFQFDIEENVEWSRESAKQDLSLPHQETPWG